MVVRVRVMGGADACGANGTCELERKSAACIAYLAIEGRQSRSRMADLLWPHAVLDSARANLRQLARRLRLALGAEVLTGGDVVHVDPGVDVDVRQLLICAEANDWSRVAACRGALLAGLHFDDCADLEDWLSLTRSRLAWTIAHALSVETARVEGEEGPAAALPLVLRWLDLDNISEEAYRRLMRLHFALGDRAAALSVYEDCRAVLSRQLQVEPSDETVALASELKSSPALDLPRVNSSRRRRIPLAALRPPLLAGRRRAWEQLDQGFASGKLVMVSGPAGIGKTRLVQDFAAQQRGHRCRYTACRPGDSELPYVYFTRAWRQELAMEPQRLSLVPPWARRELSRILPELGEAPPPISEPLERKRFFEANLELATAGDEATAVISDDVHHMDPASHELGIYLGMHFISAGSPLRSISTFRADEMEESSLGLVRSLFETGQAVHVELTPLDEDDLCCLLRSLDLTDLAREAARLHSHTGGIPFYVVETLRGLFEDGEPSELPDALSPTERIRLTIERRLGRLQPDALHLLRAAALLDERLQVHFALELMDENAARLGRAWEELERGLLIRQGAITHELLRRVVLDTMPEPAGVLLQERIALALCRAKAHPARIARHFAAAGQIERAADFLHEAASLARRMLRPEEARALDEKMTELRRALVRDDSTGGGLEEG